MDIQTRIQAAVLRVAEETTQREREEAERRQREQEEIAAAWRAKIAEIGEQLPEDVRPFVQPQLGAADQRPGNVPDFALVIPDLAPIKIATRRPPANGLRMTISHFDVSEAYEEWGSYSEVSSVHWGAVRALPEIDDALAYAAQQWAEYQRLTSEREMQMATIAAKRAAQAAETEPADAAHDRDTWRLRMAKLIDRAEYQANEGDFGDAESTLLVVVARSLVELAAAAIDGKGAC